MSSPATMVRREQEGSVAILVLDNPPVNALGQVGCAPPSRMGSTLRWPIPR